MSRFYQTPTRSATTRAGAGAISRTFPIQKPVPRPEMISFEDLFKQIQSFSTLAEEIKKIYETAGPQLDEIKRIAAAVGTAQEFHSKHEEMVHTVQRVADTFNSVKQGPPGKDAQFDMEKIISEAARRVPVPEVPIVDEVKIAKRAARLIPKPRDGEPGKHADAGAVVQILMEGGHLRAENIKMGETTLDKHLRIMDEVARRNGVRGGGDTVAQGAGILITTNNNGQKVITATGSGGFTPIPVTGTIDDSNKTFGSNTLPTLLNINGAFYLPTGGSITWTWDATVITLSSPVGAGGSIFGI